MSLHVSSPITPRGIELNMDAARPFDAVRAARELVRTARFATLSTLDPKSGYPYGVVTNVAIAADGAPIFFAPGLAIHTRNILADDRVSLALVEADAGDALLHARMTLLGRARRLLDRELDEAHERYVARHRKSKIYLALPDAALFRVEIEGLQLSGGPAQNANRLTVSSLLTDLTDASALMEVAASETTRINGAPDELAALVHLANAGSGNWRLCGIDPEGYELATPGKVVRHWFARPVATVEEFAAAIRDGSSLKA